MVYRENGDISGNDASFNSLFVNKDVSASHWYIGENGDISGNDASFNSLFVSKDISASHWYIRENGDISGNDASFNKIVITDNIIPATNNVVIGSIDNPIKDIYVSQNSLHFIDDTTKGDFSISVENGDIKFKKPASSGVGSAESTSNYVTNNMNGEFDISCGNIEIFGDLSLNDVSFSSLEISGNLIINNSTNKPYTALFKNDDGESTLSVEQTQTIPLFNFTSHTFTNCGTSGASGPTLSQCRTSYGGTDNDGNWWNDAKIIILTWTR